MESDFTPNEKIIKIFNDNGLAYGRMISGSKSGYRNKYPDNIVYFNANIITINAGKVWYGDLDLTRDENSLKSIADSLKEPLYILQEIAARFGTENDMMAELIKRAVAIVYPDGKMEITGTSFFGFTMVDGKMELLGGQSEKSK